VLTGASGGRRRRADGSSAGFGGGIGAVAVDGVVRGSSGLLGRTDRRLVALRSEPGGQRGHSKAGGKNS